jgi:hypothetical protein
MILLPFDPRPRFTLPFLLVVGALVFPRGALAAGVAPSEATPAQKKEATDHFAVGKKALEAGDFGTAVSELHASIDVVDSPNTRLELARALRGSEDIASAWAEYRSAAALAGQLAAQEPRYVKTGEVADTERKDLETKLAFVMVSVAHAPAAATLTVAGRVVAPTDWTAPVLVAPGAVDVALIDSSGGDLAQATVSAVIGQTVQVPLEGSRVGGAQPEVTTLDRRDEPPPDHIVLPEPVAPATPHKSALRPLSFVSIGVGAAGLATFGVFGLLSSSTYNDLKNTCPHGCPADKQNQVDSGIMQQTIANIGLGVGIAGVAAGVTMFLLSSPSEAPRNGAALVVAPGYIGMRGSL